MGPVENNELPSWLYTNEIRDMDFNLEKITTLINIVVQNALFTSNNTYHAQNGLAIGGDSSSELANLYLANIERRTILQHARSGTNMQCGSPAWFIIKRYMDDMVTPNTLQHLIPSQQEYGLNYSTNAEHEEVQWCGIYLKIEKNDLLFKTADKQHVIPFAMARYTHFRSMVPQNIFSSIILGAITRVKRYSTREEDAITEISSLVRKWRERLYPEEFINKIMNKRIISEFGHLLKIPEEAFIDFGRHPSHVQQIADPSRKKLIRQNQSNFCFANVILNMLHLTDTYDGYFPNHIGLTQTEEAIYSAVTNDDTQSKINIINTAFEKQYDARNLEKNDAMEFFTMLMDKVPEGNRYKEIFQIKRKIMKKCANASCLSSPIICECEEEDFGKSTSKFFITKNGQGKGTHVYINLERDTQYMKKNIRYKKDTEGIEMCKSCTSNTFNRIEFVTEWPQYLIIKTNISIYTKALYLESIIKITSENEKTITYEVIDCIIYEAEHYYSKIKMSDNSWIICNDSAQQKTLTESQKPTNSLINCMYCIICRKRKDQNNDNRNTNIENKENEKDFITEDNDTETLINLAESASSLCSQISSATATSTNTSINTSAHNKMTGRGYSNGRGSIPGRGRPPQKQLGGSTLKNAPLICNTFLYMKIFLNVYEFLDTYFKTFFSMHMIFFIFIMIPQESKEKKKKEKSKNKTKFSATWNMLGTGLGKARLTTPVSGANIHKKNIICEKKYGNNVNMSGQHTHNVKTKKAKAKKVQNDKTATNKNSFSSKKTEKEENKKERL